MVSLSMAWVIITALKEEGDVEFDMAIFVLTGIIDVAVVWVIAISWVSCQ